MLNIESANLIWFLARQLGGNLWRYDQFVGTCSRPWVEGVDRNLEKSDQCSREILAKHVFMTMNISAL